MNDNDKKILEILSKTRNLAFKTMQSYKNAMNLYVIYQNKSFDDLLKEAENEEEKSIRWKNRKLKQRLINFRMYLQQNYLISTAKVYFQRIISLYNHCCCIY